jgi:hypothetical protein
MDVPANSAIIAVNCALWFYCWNARVEVSKISFNYDRVMTHGEFWRLITSVFSHLDFMHILFNMSSLAGVASVEVSVLYILLVASWENLFESEKKNCSNHLLCLADWLVGLFKNHISSDCVVVGVDDACLLRLNRAVGSLSRTKRSLCWVSLISCLCCFKLFYL